MFLSNMTLSRSVKLAIMLSVAFMLLSQPAFADAVLYKSLNDAGFAALDRGKYAEAERQFQSALKETADFPEKDPRKRDLLRTLAEVKVNRSKTAEAVELWKQAVAIDEKVRGAGSPDLGVDLTGYASVLVAMEQYADAQSAADRAVAILEKKADSPEQLLRALHAQGIIYQAVGKESEAEATYRKALAFAQKSAGKGKPFTAPQLEWLAVLYLQQKKVLDAEPLLKQALAENEQLGPDAPATVHGELLLARLYLAQGKMSDAEALLKKGIASLEKNPRPGDEYTSLVAELSKLYLSRGDYPQSIKLLQGAVQTQQDAFGEDNLKVAELLRQLTKPLTDADQYVAAERAAEKALEISVKCEGSPVVVAPYASELARVFMLQGKYEKAEKLYLYALQLIVEGEGTKSPNLIIALNSDGLLNYDWGKLEKADAILEKARKLRTDSCTDCHDARIAIQMFHLARVRISRQQYASAESLLKEALPMLIDTQGETGPITVEVMRTLAELYSITQQPTQTEKLYRKLLKNDELANEDGAIAGDLECLSQALVAQNDSSKTEEAVALQKRADSIKSKLPGYRSPSSSASQAVAPADAADNGSNASVHDKWALVIGISNFKDTDLNLKFAAKDATDFKNYLINEANFAPDHVKLLLDQDATRQNITNYLGDKYLGKVATCNDLVVVYISTHGSSAVEQLGNANFVVPYDATMNNLILTGIPMKYLTAGIKDLIHCNRVVLVADVCHGGAMDDTVASRGGGSGASAGGTGGEGGKGVEIAAGEGGKGMHRAGIINDNVQVGAGQLIVASSEADQISWESKNYPNGVFTRKLIDGLRLKGTETTLKDAYSYMKARVEEEVLRDRAQVQTPVFIANKWKGAEVVLGVKPCSPGPGIQVDIDAKSAAVPVSDTTRSIKKGAAPNTVKTTPKSN